MDRDMFWLVVALMVLCWNYRQARADGGWSWALVLGFFVALGIFGAGYMWPMMNSKWLAVHPDAFGWVVFGPGAVLVAGFYAVTLRVQKAQKARLNEASGEGDD